MSYVGRSPKHGFLEGQTATFNGSTTVVTLLRSVSTTDALDVYIDNVHQEPDVAYTLSSGGSAITFTGTPANGQKLYIRFHGISFDTARAFRLANTNADSTLTLTDSHTLTLDLNGTTALTATASGITIPNLTVTGTTTSVNSTNLEVGDNQIILNSDVGSGVAPSEDAGIVINRGSSADVAFLWDEGEDYWLAADPIVSSTRLSTIKGGTTPTIASSTVGLFQSSASSQSAALSIIANSGQSSILNFGDENDENAGSLTYSHSADTFALSKGLGVTGNIAVSGTVDGVDIAARDSVLTSTTTTAGAALPKAGGTLTGNLRIEFSNNDGSVGGQVVKNTNTGTTSNFASVSYQAVNGGVQGTFGAAHYPTWGGSIAFAGTATNHPFNIVTNNAVRATVDATGNVGIGVSVPTYRIDAATTSGGNGLKISRGSNSFFEEFQSTSGGVYLAASGSGAFMGFRTGTTAGTTTERLRIDAVGTLAVGTTDTHTWSTFDGRIRVGARGIVATTTGSTQIGHNWYFDGGGSTGYKYIGADYASRIVQANGYVSVETAASGSADAAITFAEKFKIENNGVAHFSGDVKVLSGDIQMGNGRGINFSPHHNTSGMTSETLKDYEEGTHDCTVTMTSGSCSLYANYNKIRYTKIGNLVTIQGQIRVQYVSSPSGEMMVSMPFSIDTSSDEGMNVGGSAVRTYLGNAPTGGLFLHGVMVFNRGDKCLLQWVKSGSATVDHVPTANEYLIFNFSYMAA